MFNLLINFLVNVFIKSFAYDQANIANGRLIHQAQTSATQPQEDIEAKLYRATLNPNGKTQYGNMGYWQNGVITLDAAGEAMARILGQAGGLGPGVCVLDAGCGCGDEDFLWAEEFKPDHILAVDINPLRVEAAQDHATALGISDRLTFRVGSAVDLDLHAATMDRVLSLESPHTFVSREAFIREAFRVLVPGGKLAFTDLVPFPGQKFHHFAIPDENAHSGDILIQKLKEAGFVRIEVKSLREHVIDPFHRYLSKLPMNRGFLGKIRMLKRKRVAAKLDYVLVTACKPN